MVETHDEGAAHLLHMARTETGGALEEMARRGALDVDTMGAFFVAMFMAGADIGLRVGRAKPDRLDEFIGWVEDILYNECAGGPEYHERMFVGERPFLFGEDEEL